ncbi:MAG: FAD-dependent oxidoreductase [Desulfobacteraceae bacterium]|nr:FAD-dependent oxidoreductase [Desulfobacteraceae bacterium]
MIIRNPSAAEAGRYDLIVIGGGIYGVMLAFEAGRRGLRALLLERDDFGSHTSFNSLRILHGGLRYLQKLDLKRFRESVGERQWFLRNFPALVQPLPCLMPLYGDGMRRPAILRAALAANHLLSLGRNRGVAPDRRLPKGGILPAGEVRRLFPAVDPAGLQGGALWYDAVMPDSQRLLMEILRWACGLGACALNYMEATTLLQYRNQVVGVIASDRESSSRYEFKATKVINAAGPWCREVAQSAGPGGKPLFTPSLAWNVLLDRRPPAPYGLALTPRRPGAQTYFLVPWKGKLLAGTGHLPWEGHQGRPRPSAGQLEHFLAGLNAAAPGLAVAPDQVLHVLAGLLPAARPGTAELATREVIVDHGRAGGLENFFSVSGVKFTTARLVAHKTLSLVFPEAAAPLPCEKLAPVTPRGVFLDGQGLAGDVPAGELRTLIAEESVRSVDDLLYRRTDLWLVPALREKLPAEAAFPSARSQN